MKGKKERHEGNAVNGIVAKETDNPYGYGTQLEKGKEKNLPSRYYR